MRVLGNNRGQGMTEYIIIVALIAIAAIAAFAYFGQTIRTQTTAMTMSVAGSKDAGAEAKKAETVANQAKSEDKAKDLQTYAAPAK